ncbi:MAG: UDP-glucose dehydrogenase family protein [Clostridia bacterium]
MQKIAIVGTGYVGLVTGACLSDFGMKVICIDKDIEKINNLNVGHIPIYETGLDLVVERNTEHERLSFTTDIEMAVKESDVIFIAVGTPPLEDGSADLQYVKAVAADIARYMNGYKVIVNKSTVPIGTAKMVKETINTVLVERNVSYECDVVSNPEFLREGTAVYDFTHPDRVVIGADSEKAIEVMKKVYKVLYLNETPFVITNVETAEMIKYASNAFLAMKITFINEIANLCEKVGANVQDVAKAVGKDGRIGTKFLHPGPGYGGSCFPKDTRALVEIGKKYGSPMTLIEKTAEANERQKHLMVEKIESAMGNIKGKRLAILGLAFKNNTDDIRESPAITILTGLMEKGAVINVYDPAAMIEARLRLKNIEDNIVYCNDEYEAINEADAVVIVTEWNQFRNLDLDKIKKSLNEPYFFDLRNIYKKNDMIEMGFKYYGVGQ